MKIFLPHGELMLRRICQLQTNNMHNENQNLYICQTHLKPEQ